MQKVIPYLKTTFSIGAVLGATIPFFVEPDFKLYDTSIKLQRWKAVPLFSLAMGICFPFIVVSSPVWIVQLLRKN
jgi:hypothetical protein